jgi:hypothetical protein
VLRLVSTMIRSKECAHARTALLPTMIAVE